MIITLLINNTIYSQSSYKVSGEVFLEDKLLGGPYDGVIVKFYSLPGKILKISTLPLTDRSYLKFVSDGSCMVASNKSESVICGNLSANKYILSRLFISRSESEKHV